MSRSTKRNLPSTVTFRVTPEQIEVIREAARPLSPGQFARRITLAAAGIEGPKPGRRPLSRVQDVELLRAAMAELGHIGGNLNQLAHIANMGMPWEAAEVAALRADLLPVRDRILLAIGLREGGA